MPGLAAGGSVLAHGLAVRAERVAFVNPFAGGADGVVEPLSLSRDASPLAGTVGRARGPGWLGLGGPGVPLWCLAGRRAIAEVGAGAELV